MFNEEILSISQLTEYMKSLLESDPLLQNVTVRGELSNFYRHSSGHLYFTLKDRDAQLKCVMFRSSAQYVKFQPENGMNLIASGALSIYPNRGEYQMYVRNLQPDGIGALHLAFEQLKAKLTQEGLFAEEVKLPIPRLPRRIGVITSPTGAAIRDIISVIRRRFPFVEILVAPAQVQGNEAAASLIRALKLLHTEEIDVIIMGRGGGSIEDLWAFNEEKLARAIFASQIPIISAVGHETDFTIADFVADLRAPTPSAAAELAVANFEEMDRYLSSLERRLEQCMARQVQALRDRVQRAVERRIFIHPEEVFLRSWQRVDDLERRLHRSMDQQMKLVTEQCRTYFKQLESLSPLSVLSRGFSLTEKMDGTVVKSMQDVEQDELIRIRLADGAIQAKIEKGIE